MNQTHTCNTFSKRHKQILINILFSFAILYADNLAAESTVTAGYSLDSSSVWRKTVPLFPLPNDGRFSDFEGKVPNMNLLKKYWYAFDDGNKGGNSQITGGATLDTETSLYTLQWYDETGSTKHDTGLQLKYRIGDPVSLGENRIPGFAGFGCNTYDSIQVKYFNAYNNGFNTIYFHYITYGNVSFLRLEISDINDVADRNNPGRKDGRGPGVVWHKNFPNTGDKWVAVALPFDSLFINSDTNVVKKLPLDLTKLAKFTWRVFGGKGDSGTVAIDNVYLLKGPAVANNAVFLAKKSKTIIASYTNRMVIVLLERELIKGNLSVFTSNGTCIVSRPFCSKVAFSLARCPTGIYIVKITASDSNGKRQFMQMPVTIVN